MAWAASIRKRQNVMNFHKDMQREAKNEMDAADASLRASDRDPRAKWPTRATQKQNNERHCVTRDACLLETSTEPHKCVMTRFCCLFSASFAAIS